jgi:hypothetical protein
MQRDELIEYLKNRIPQLQKVVNIVQNDSDNDATSSTFLRGELYATVHILAILLGDYSRENTAEVLVTDGGEHF